MSERPSDAALLRAWGVHGGADCPSCSPLVEDRHLGMCSEGYGIAEAIDDAVRAEAAWIADTVEKCGARYRELGLNEAASAAEEIAENVRSFRIRRSGEGAAE